MSDRAGKLQISDVSLGGMFPPVLWAQPGARDARVSLVWPLYAVHVTHLCLRDILWGVVRCASRETQIFTLMTLGSAIHDFGHKGMSAQRVSDPAGQQFIFKANKADPRAVRSWRATVPLWKACVLQATLAVSLIRGHLCLKPRLYFMNMCCLHWGAASPAGFLRFLGDRQHHIIQAGSSFYCFLLN